MQDISAYGTLDTRKWRSRQVAELSTTHVLCGQIIRNFANCVNRAHYQNVTFVLLKNGSPVARLVPDTEKVCLGRELAAAMAKAELSAVEARAWRHDFHPARKTLKAPADRWR